MQSVIQVHAVAADLTDSAGIAAVCKEVEEALGPIDVLVNNAGMSREGPALSLREEAYDDVMAINTRAPYFLAQHVARQMVRHKREGSIINVSSAVATRVVNGISAYAMSKAAIDQACLWRLSAATPWPRVSLTATCRCSDDACDGARMGALRHTCEFAPSRIHRDRDQRAHAPASSKLTVPPPLPRVTRSPPSSTRTSAKSSSSGCHVAAWERRATWTARCCCLLATAARS